MRVKFSDARDYLRPEAAGFTNQGVLSARNSMNITQASIGGEIQAEAVSSSVALSRPNANNAARRELDGFSEPK
jgi:hypothetical protein